MSHQPRPGRHELGQNFLVDQRVVARVAGLVAERPGPITEWGTGDGALTLALAGLGRPLVGIEIDPVRARALDRRTGPHVCISEGDILRHAPPSGATVVSNVPFHLTTPILRHLLASPGWAHAVLITQWEVARKRAAVGGTSQLTAQWWPWFSFTLGARVPSAAFRPRPSIDGGILMIDRLDPPLVDIRERQAYQAWVARVFQGGGKDLVTILTRQGVDPAVARHVASRHADPAKRRPLPRDLTCEGWIRAHLSTTSRRRR